MNRRWIAKSMAELVRGSRCREIVFKTLCFEINVDTGELIVWRRSTYCIFISAFANANSYFFFCLSGSVGCGEGAVTAYKKIYIYSRMSYIQTKLFIKVLVLPVPSLKMLQRDNLYVYENLSQRQFKLVLFTIQNIYYANFPRIFQNGC